MSNIYKKPIIIDLGTSEIKLGFSGQDNPLLLSNYIGELKSNSTTSDTQKKFYISKECDSIPAENLLIRNTMEYGAFKNDDYIPSVFNYIYTNLSIKPDEIKEHPLLISEPIHNIDKNSETISEILFEKFGVPSLVFGSQPVLSFFSTSKSTGAILESGDAITQCCVCYEGFLIKSSCFRYNYGGSDVTKVLKNLIENNNNFKQKYDMKIFKNMKEKQCFYKTHEEQYKVKYYQTVISDYMLPDGSIIKVGNEKIIAPEILFNNRLNYSDFPTFHEIIYNSIIKVDINIIQKLYQNIILSGGNTLFYGMENKMTKFIKKIAPGNATIEVKRCKNPQFSCWNGGNVISLLDSFKNLLVDKKEWNEQGRKIIHEKNI